MKKSLDNSKIYGKISVYLCLGGKMMKQVKGFLCGIVFAVGMLIGVYCDKTKKNKAA